MPQLTLQVTGLHCADEVHLLRAAVEPLEGVHRVSIQLLEQCMTVDYAPGSVTPSALLQAVRASGLSATIIGDGQSARSEPVRGRRLRTALTAGSGVLLLVAFAVHAAWTGVVAALHDEIGVPSPAIVLYIAATLAGGWFVWPRAWGALRRMRPDMSLLMTLAVMGAITIGQYLEGASVAFLFAVSLELEAWSVGRARQAIGALLSLAPPTARVLGADGKEAMIAAAAVVPGARFLVKPGEKLPLDGRVVAGRSAIDQSPITGESVPVDRQVGDEVYAGSINQDGAIEVEATKRATDTVVAQIARLVGDAQGRRAPTELWVETFAHYYTPVVLVAAVVMAGIVPLLVGNWSGWCYEALVLLVIACPCALVISTPVTIVTALARAAHRGVLIKGGEFVELPARLRAVALDKTGTLTLGRPVVREAVTLSGHSINELLAIASAIEQRSEHPLARAIVAHATDLGIKPAPVDDYCTQQGRGATARLGTKTVWLGSHRYLEERGVETREHHSIVERLAASGATVVVVGEDQHVCGVIALADELRPEAATAVRALRRQGVEHVVMLTGDNEAAAKAVALGIGVTDYRAELLPHQKVEAIGELVARYGAVAMVGDGINDAPALARATIGIAMGALGTDAAIATADVALMSDDLTCLPWLVEHSRTALRVMRANVAASLLVKAAFVVLALSGFASLWAAIAADIGVTLAVVANSMRLLRNDGPSKGPGAVATQAHSMRA